MKELQHIIFGINKRNSGTFEHSFGLAKALNRKGHKVKYCSHWFDSNPKLIDVSTGEEREVDIANLKNGENKILHFHTHTYEHDGLMVPFEGDKFLYTFHAIPIFLYMNTPERDKFLKGEMSEKEIKKIVDSKVSDLQKFQIEISKKASGLIAISKTHKKVLGLLDFKQPTYVLENVSDFTDLTDQEIFSAKIKANELKNRLNKENVLLYCGRIYPSKGTSRLFDAFERIKENYSNSAFVLIGTRKTAEELIEHGLNPALVKDVHVVNWLDGSKPEDREKFLGYHFASDVVIQPMISPELYGKVSLDAMALGVPVISCESPYTIGNSETAEDIFDSFDFLKKNPSVVKRITEKAQKKVFSENTWDSYIFKLAKAVNEMISRKN